MSKRQVAGWVWESNVDRLMSWLALFTGYDYKHLDATGVANGVADTDVDAHRWYEYPLGGEPALLVRLSQQVGGSEVNVVVLGAMDPVLEARVQTLVDVLADVDTGR